MQKNKLSIWNQNCSFEEAEQAWDHTQEELKKSHPLKTLSSLPKMPGITADTKKGLAFKAMKYLLCNDPKKIFLRHFSKRPLQYTYHLVRSWLCKRSYTRDDDFFFYGLNSTQEFCQKLKNKDSILTVGFSYCHKPMECPSGRFSAECQHSLDNPVCRQCFIGKTVHALPPLKERLHVLFIPTIHYIGEELFKLREKHPRQTLLFLITACEMTLEMFGNWGNMIQAKGIGVRLDGRICNTMRAFELSEEGIKPGLTVVLPHTQRRILDLIKTLWTSK